MRHNGKIIIEITDDGQKLGMWIEEHRAKIPGRAEIFPATEDLVERLHAVLRAFSSAAKAP